MWTSLDGNDSGKIILFFIFLVFVVLIGLAEMVVGRL